MELRSEPSSLERIRDLAARLALSAPLAACLLGLVTALMVLRAHALLNPDPFGDSDALWALRDFRDSIYYPALALFDGVNPYDPQAYRAAYPVHTFPLYSPLNLVLYAPLTVFPLEVARWVYFGLTVSLYGALAFALLRFAGYRFRLAHFLLLWTAILLSRPGHQNLLNGQSTAQAVLGILLAVHYAGRRPVLAGIGLALASLKPTFGVPLIVLLLCKRHVKTVLGSSLVIGLAALAVLGVLAHQHGGVMAVIDALQRNLGVYGQHPNTALTTSYSRIDLTLFLSRWSGWIPGTGAALLIGAGPLLLAGVALALRNRREVELGMCSWSSVLICFTVPLCIYHQSYDALTLMIPVLALTGAQRLIPPAGAPALRPIVLACALLPLVNYVATDGVLSKLALEHAAWRLVTVINATIIVIGFLACLLAARRAPLSGR